MMNYMGKSVNNLGNFDDCLSLNDTKYCLSNFDVQSLPLVMGLCVPGVCDGPQLEMALDSILRNNVSDVAVRISVLVGLIENNFGPYPLSTPSGISKIKATCYNSNQNKPSTGALVVISVIISLALLTLTASLLDYYLPSNEVTKVAHKPIKHDHEPSESDTKDDGNNLIAMKDLSHSDSENAEESQLETSPPSFAIAYRDMFGMKLLLSFSVLHNLKSLSAKERSSETQFLNGIRVLSMFYVMLGHTNAFMLVAPILDLYYFFNQIYKALSFQIIVGGVFAVDSFYFLSGMLVCMTLLDLLKKEKAKVNWFLVYFHRWWRLTPLFFLTIWITAYLGPFLSNGPISHAMGDFGFTTSKCEQYWWTNPLYINNFVPWVNVVGDNCVVWGWYLANDMQFFLITPAFLILYLKNKKIGIIAAISLLLASLIGVGIYVGVTNLNFGDSNWFSFYYIKPWSRVGPYFIGSAVAVLWKEKGEVKISAPYRFLAYLSSAVLLITTVFGTYTNVDFEWNVIEKIFYHTFSRSGFILGLAILSYLMLNKQAVFIRALLSFQFWTPLARLSFGAYLLHPVVMISAYSSTRIALSWDIWSISVYYCGFIVLSYSASFVFWLILEKPMANLEKEVISWIKGSPVVLI